MMKRWKKEWAMRDIPIEIPPFLPNGDKEDAMLTFRRSLIFGALITMVWSLLTPLSPSWAVTARYHFETAYDNIASGDWYCQSHNETANLAWGESYVMMSLAAMFRATGQTIYLDRLAYHADHVWQQTDAARGVSDYRGESNECWRNTSYQSDGEPYCYAVHSGMIAAPIAEFVLLVRNRPDQAKLLAYDGQSYADKAADYLEKLRLVIASHDDEFVKSGTGGGYAFQDDADFTCCPGKIVPLNQSHAMGQLLLTMGNITKDSRYFDKARRLANSFKNSLTIGSHDEYLWNYWGDAYSAPGEDISHAALSLNFAAMAASYGVVFTAEDMTRFSNTFMASIYHDSETFADCVGGGSLNGNAYKAQAGRWLVLAPWRLSIYQAVRDYYDQAFPADSIGSGSILLGLAYLAEFEPYLCEHSFAENGWLAQTGYRQATLPGANILTSPLGADLGCLIPLQIRTTKSTAAQQWDGSLAHLNAVWPSTENQWRPHYLAYEPQWLDPRRSDAALFEMRDDFVSGEGIEIMEPAGASSPKISSSPNQNGAVGLTYQYDSDNLPTMIGREPAWWSLSTTASNATIDYRTGAINWTPAAPGEYVLSLRVETDYGQAVQTFSVSVPGVSTGCPAGLPQNTTIAGLLGLLLLPGVIRRWA
jgi:hypothetical protein